MYRNMLWLYVGASMTRLTDIAFDWAGMRAEYTPTGTVLCALVLGASVAILSYDAGRRRAALAAAGERENG